MATESVVSNMLISWLPTFDVKITIVLRAVNDGIFNGTTQHLPLRNSTHLADCARQIHFLSRSTADQVIAILQ
jgi:hypothetical protein